MKILIVEDNLDSRELLMDALEFAGFDPILAGDGEEGEQKAKDTLPDLILLDVSLPKKSGWDVAKSLREHEATQAIPIVALTAHAREEDREHAMSLGCNSYLPKPVKPKDVIQEIQRLLNL